MKIENLGKRIAMSLFGVIICAISVGIFKIAALGVDPFQSFMAGLDSLVPIKFGTLYVITNAVLLLFALIFDRHILKALRLPSIVRRLFMILCVVTGYALFSAESLQEAGTTFAALFSFRSGGTVLFWLRENILLLAVSLACCVPAVIEGGKRLLSRHTILRCITMTAVLLLCLAALAKSSYNPFIYFRF